jgi:heptosyltransferase-2/heptosyltransferase-3
VGRIALASAGYDLEGFDPFPSLEVPAARRAAARARLAGLGPRVVAVHPGSSRTKRLLARGPHLKGLSPEQWAGLLACLLEVGGGADSVVVLGSRAEAPRTEEITRLVPHLSGRVQNLCGDLTLGELAAVLAEVEALVSIDSGPAHVAAAVSCPLLEVFGPTDPALYSPRSRAPVASVLGTAPCQFCEGTRQWKTCRDNVCMKSLGVETLFAAWHALNERLRFEEGTGVRQSAV